MGFRRTDAACNTIHSRVQYGWIVRKVAERSSRACQNGQQPARQTRRLCHRPAVSASSYPPTLSHQPVNQKCPSVPSSQFSLRTRSMTSRCVTLCFILSSLAMVASIPTTARKRHSGHELQPNTFSSPRRAVRDRPGLGLSSHRLSHLSGATTPVSKDAVQNRSMLVLLAGCSALIAAGSIVLLVFASLAHLHIPARNLVAAVALAFASLLLEALVGHPRRTSFVGQTISEVGQALVIAAAGWVCFSSSGPMATAPC